MNTTKEIHKTQKSEKKSIKPKIGSLKKSTNIDKLLARWTKGKERRIKLLKLEMKVGITREYNEQLHNNIG